jgi:hypothetical protein
VLTSQRRADRERRVQVVRHTQVDQVDLGIIQDRIQVCHGTSHAEFVGEGSAAFWATRTHSAQFNRRRSKATVAVGVDTGYETSANQTNPDRTAHPSSRT